MPQAVQNPPAGYHSLTPYMTVRDAHAAIDFYRRAFGAEKVMQLDMPDGSVAHAEVRIGDSVVMVGESADASVPSPAVLYVYVADVDATYRRALASGATTVREPADQFYGDRSATLEDPSGHRWFLATHKEDLTPDEIDRRRAAQEQTEVR